MAALSAHFWKYLWCGDCLAEWASFVTILSLGIAPLWYMLRKETDRRGEVTTVSTGIYMELSDARDGLDDDRHADLRAVKLSNGETARFMSRMFNHDIYDSLIHSGKISAVRAEHQQHVQDVFQMIKDHSASLKKIRNVELAGERGVYEGYYRHLDRTDAELRVRIPALMNVLGRRTASPAMKSFAGLTPTTSGRPARPAASGRRMHARGRGRMRRRAGRSGVRTLHRALLRSAAPRSQTARFPEPPSRGMKQGGRPARTPQRPLVYRVRPRVYGHFPSARAWNTWAAAGEQPVANQLLAALLLLGFFVHGGGRAGRYLNRCGGRAAATIHI